MAENQDKIAKLYAETTHKLVANVDSWKDFLQAMGRLYKYPYHEQLMIYAQNPKATACAEVDIWNKALNRILKSGANAIALMETNMGKNPIRYVFDIADTDRGQHGKELHQWQLNKDNQETVAEMLSKTYDLKESYDISNNIAILSFSLAQDYIKEHPVDYREFAQGTVLEGEDLAYISASVEHATAVSISYTLLHRMGLEADNFFSKEDFEPLFQLMSTENISYLGTAISQQSEQVFREIETTIKKYEKEQEHGTDLSERGGISSTQPRNGTEQANPTGEIRQNEGKPPETAQPPTVPPSPVVGATAQPLDGNRQDSNETSETPDGRPDQTKPTSQQGEPATALGSTHEQSASTGRGNSLGGTDFQLNQGQSPEEYTQTSMFPSVSQQVAEITERVAEGNKNPEKQFTLTEQEIVKELREYASLKVDGKLRIYDLFQQDLSARERIEALKDEYGHAGHSAAFADESRGYIDYSPSVGLVAWKTHTREETSIP